MTRTGDRLARVEAALAHLEQAVSRIAAALDPGVQGSIAARLLAETREGRSSGEAASAAVQALRALLTPTGPMPADPGPAPVPAAGKPKGMGTRVPPKPAGGKM